MAEYSNTFGEKAAQRSHLQFGQHDEEVGGAGGVVHVQQQLRGEGAILRRPHRRAAKAAGATALDQQVDQVLQVAQVAAPAAISKSQVLLQGYFLRSTISNQTNMRGNEELCFEV